MKTTQNTADANETMATESNTMTRFRARGAQLRERNEARRVLESTGFVRPLSAIAVADLIEGGVTDEHHLAKGF